MCEYCLQYRCPAACPNYGYLPWRPSGRRWKFRRIEENPIETTQKIVWKIERTENDKNDKEREETNEANVGF